MRYAHWSRLRILPVLLAVALGAVHPAPAAAPAGQPALVLLVRHAEKAAGPGADPALTPAGTERAKALAAALEEAGVTAIVTTQWRRTQDTAAPLAQALGIKPEVVEAGAGGPADHVAAVVAAVRKHPGGVVLVVGHANTVPALVAALGGPKLHDLGDNAYSTLFVLVPGPAKARLVTAHYGAPDPAGPARPMM